MRGSRWCWEVDDHAARTEEGEHRRADRPFHPEAEEDHSLDGWAGVVPLKLTAGTPRNCGDLRPDIATPEYAKNYSR